LIRPKKRINNSKKFKTKQQLVLIRHHHFSLRAYNIKTTHIQNGACMAKIMGPAWLK
jgi:hypothetical protein